MCDPASEAIISSSINTSTDVLVDAEGNVIAYEDVIDITFVENPNYNITIVKGDYTINKATYDMSEVVFEDLTVTYDGTEHELVISGTLPGGVEVGYTANKLTNKGVLEVTASFTGDGTNYEEISSMTATLTVEAREVTITADNKESVYGTEVVAGTYTVTSGSILAQDLTGLGIVVVIDSAIINTTTDVKYEAGVVVAYEDVIDITYTEDANYEITIVKGSYKVTPATIDLSTVEFNDETKPYNGLAQTIEAPSVPANVKATVSGERTNVGTSEIRVTFESLDSNYILSDYEMTAELTIEALVVTITPNTATSVFGEEIKGNGYTYTGTIISSDLAGLNIQVVVDESITTDTAVGTYEDVVSITYEENENYVITTETADYVITAESIDTSVIVFEDKEVIYNGTAQTIEATNIPEKDGHWIIVKNPVKFYYVV